jgi:phosphoribosylformimino-5-aminoimidazole carboxamide ribotide isomerase
MDVIPVIDVRFGVAVQAVRGQRSDYRPLRTPLAEGSDPLAVAAGLMRLASFSTLYVADLDGIEGRGGNAGLVDLLAAALPGVAILVDDGAPVREAAARIAGGIGAVTPVIGTESLASEADVAAMRALPHAAYVLSLDFKDGCFAGPQAVLNEPEHWPQRVIAMTLARVGSGDGPDMSTLSEILRLGGGRAVYAAGGVRDASDLEALRDLGCAGALVASALHSGKITAGDLNEIAGRR